MIFSLFGLQKHVQLYSLDMNMGRNPKNPNQKIFLDWSIFYLWISKKKTHFQHGALDVKTKIYIMKQVLI